MNFIRITKTAHYPVREEATLEEALESAQKLDHADMLDFKLSLHLVDEHDNVIEEL